MEERKTNVTAMLSALRVRIRRKEEEPVITCSVVNAQEQHNKNGNKKSERIKTSYKVSELNDQEMANV